MAKWKREGLFFEPLFKIRCLACEDPHAELERTEFTPLHFALDDDKLEEKNSYALDQVYVCSLCGWEIVFGIAISKKHHKELSGDFGKAEQMETYF